MVAIKLDTLDVSPDMYLDNVLQEELVTTQVDRNLDGEANIIIKSKTGGNLMTLGSQTGSNGIQGIWHQQDLEDINTLIRSKRIVVLDYRGDLYNVIVLSISNLRPFETNEIEGPCKRFTANINLIEV